MKIRSHSGLLNVAGCLFSAYYAFMVAMLCWHLLIIFTFSLTMQLNSTAVTTFELHIDEEVDNGNKLYKWYERSMVRTVHGTNSQWYEKSRHPLSATSVQTRMCNWRLTLLSPRARSRRQSAKEFQTDRAATMTARRTALDSLWRAALCLQLVGQICALVGL